MSDGCGRSSNTGAGTGPALKGIAARGCAVPHPSLRGSGKPEGEAA